jgi:trimeric autotransporter adhesin
MQEKRFFLKDQSRFSRLAHMKATFSILTLMLAATGLYAQGTTFTYQGRVNAGGTPANGIYDLVFTIYDSLGGPGAFANQTNSATVISNGLFTATLDFGPGIFTGPDRWLEIEVRTNGVGGYVKLNPRQKITPTPYAITAGNLVSGALLSGNGGGLTNINAVTLGGLSASNFWNTGGNAGTTPGVNFLGTTDNQPLVVKVNNTTALQFMPGNTLPNVVGGLAAFRPSVITPGVSGAVIAGGNAPSGAVSGFGGGDFQAVYDNNGAIGGGFGNKVGNGNADVTDAAFATVAGGVFNSAANYAATVAGGDGNYSAGSRSFIGGGYGNVTSGDFTVLGGGLQNLIQPGAPYSTIAGGINNFISTNSPDSTIGGGTNNVIRAAESFPFDPAIGTTIAGGYQNSITNGGNTSSPSWATIGGGLQNVSSALMATVAGGRQNICSGWSATIGGGDFNVSSGINSTVPGGGNCTASGYYSFAAGSHAKAVHNGSFVWADSQFADFSSTANDQVSFRCLGGTRFTSGAGGANQTVSWAPGSASWSFSSDRALKEGFEAVDGLAVLEKVARLPISEWNYKGYPQRHIGTMAQDFHAAFPLNESTTTLNDADLHGVALAAIQGLNQKMEERLKAKDAEIEQLKSNIEELRRMMLKSAANQQEQP